MNRSQGFYRLGSVIILLVMMVLVGCKHEKNKDNKQYATSAIVKSVVLDQVLIYSGRLQPAHAFYVASPVDGYINKMAVSYGDHVDVEQVLFSVTDPKIEQDFVDAVINYLKNKDGVDRAKTKFMGEKDMLAAGIIAQDDYRQDQTDYENSYIDFAKSSIKLKRITGLIGSSYEEIAKLHLSDLDKIEKLLMSQPEIEVKANQKGVVLAPGVIQNDGGTNDAKPISIGSKVEKGQMLAVIAGRKGLKVTIKVNEKDVNHIRQGMSATLMSYSYEGHDIPAQVKAVHIYNMQQDGSTSKMVFPVTLVAKELSQKDKKHIHIGMDVKVTIHLGKRKLLMVPIRAVSEEKNRYYVTLIAADGHKRKIMVITGKTTAANVAISGKLKVGDKVMLHD